MLAKVAQHGKTNKLYACEVTTKYLGVAETATQLGFIFKINI
jgi:hypothetical protein